MKLKMTFLLAAFAATSIFAQDNLLKGSAFETGNDVLAWAPGHWVHIGPALGDYKKLLPQVSPYCKRMLVQDAKSGRWSMKVVTDKEYHKIKDNKGGVIMVSNSLNQTVAVTPGKYKLTFWVKGKMEKVPGYNALRLFITCTKTSQLLDHQFKLTDNWVQFQKEITVPAQGASLQIRFALYGVGEFQIDDVTLEKVQ